MRKVFSIFTLALLVLASTACSDDKDSAITKLQADVLNNVVNIGEGQSEKVSSSLISVEWNYTENTITLSYAVPMSAGSVVNVNVTNAALKTDNNLSCYTFESANAGNGITNFKGLYNPNNGTMHIEFIVAGTYFVSSNADLFFPYTTITVTNTEQENATPVESKNAAMIIVIDPTNMSAMLGLGNFTLSTNDATISEIFFRDLKATATANGFVVTLDSEKQATNDSNKTLNSFQANVTGNGRVVNATFTMDEKYSGTITGTQFAK